MSRHWQAADIPSMAGKRVLITGANSGIGYQAALKLARKGAHVMLACRDQQRGEAALARLDTDAPSAHTELVVFDLASLASIRGFAEKELAQHRPLHILINNAGVMAPPKRLQTADGFELQFGTNVLGHFALTALLMPALNQPLRSLPTGRASSRSHRLRTSEASLTSMTSNPRRATAPWARTSNRSSLT